MAANPLKIRLDQLLVERGLAASRLRAQALILAGKVYSGARRLDKAGMSLTADQPIELRAQDHPWVSRGGLKLAAALEAFTIDPAGLTAIDIGASTGGFTDVLLERGAAKIFAVDVGHGQLAWKLRQNDRVVVMERTNARYLTVDLIPDAIDLVVCDASFIGLRTVLPAALALLRPGGRLVALIKPQFEVGKRRLGKGGVVVEGALHQAVCDDIRRWLEQECGWQTLGITDSPILGPKGNREFLVAACKPGGFPGAVESPVGSRFQPSSAAPASRAK